MSEMANVLVTNTRSLATRKRHDLCAYMSLANIRQHYYEPTRDIDLTPLFAWGLLVMGLAVIPASIYGSITGQSTLPASDPLGALALAGILIAYVGGFTLHAALYIHGRYRKSRFVLRSPIAVE